MSDKAEYFAVRTAAGIFDSSPLYKYRISGRDAETFLAGMLARDIRACPPGHAQYTCWLDDRGFVIEDGVILHLGRGRLPPDERRAQLRLVRRPDRPPRRPASRRSATRSARSPSRARARATCSSEARPADGAHPVLRGRQGRDRRRGGDREPDRLQRRPRLRDLGRRPRRAPRLGHAVGQHGRATASSRSGSPRCTCSASRPACSSSTPTSTRAGSPGTTPTAPRRSSSAGAWMFRDLAERRSGVHRPPRARARDRRARRRAGRMRGLVVDWEDYDRVYNEAGLIPPKDHTPVVEDWMRLRRRLPAPGRLCDELHVLADAPAPHRDRPGPRPTSRGSARA